MKVDRLEAIRSLRQKGFREDKTRDHIYFYHEYNGKETGPCTKISHSRRVRDISGDLLLSMRKQLRLDTNRDAVDLLSCPMDGDEFNSKMKAKGIF